MGFVRVENYGLIRANIVIHIPQSPQPYNAREREE